MNERDKIHAHIEKLRKELNAIPWWHPLKRQDAAVRYKNALLMGALWEIGQERR